MDQIEHTLTDRQKYWLEHVKACDASGKAIADYTREQGIDLKSMYAGKRNLVQKGILPRTRTTRFQRVRATAVASGNDWQVQIAQWRNGWFFWISRCTGSDPGP